MKILFLDDMPERMPLLRRGEEVEYVRNPAEFVGWLTRYGTPDVISFDHDLSDQHYTADGGYMNPDRPPSGTDCARWCVENGFVPRIVVVHSWNPEGANRIARCFIRDNQLVSPCKHLLVASFNPRIMLLPDAVSQSENSE